MAIESTYRTLLIEDFIKNQLSRGVSVSAIDIEDEIDESIAGLDLTNPQFIAEDHHVQRVENSSATKHKDTFLDIRQDLRVLYKDMINLTKTSIEAFERWGLESFSIEKRLIDLEDRIENLLILTQDTQGFSGIIVDNFTDTGKVDLTNSTAEVDIECAAVEMVADPSVFSRIFLNELELPDDVTFKVRTTIDFLSRVDQVEAILSDPFNQESKTWWSNITMRTRGPVTTELTVRLNPDGPIKLSRIFMELHDSAESSPISITPLYTVDNINFNQLPTNTFTIEAKSVAAFSFEEVEAKWIKFILTKRGPDPSGGTEFFNYQFGFKNIRFFEQAFSQDDTQHMITTPLFLTDPDNLDDVVSFDKLTLETCERIETGTAINYFITVSDNAAVPLIANENINETAEWFPISPVNRTIQPHPVILNVGDVTEQTFGDDEVVKVAYDGRATDPDFVNPSASFKLLSKSGTTILDESITATVPRYNFINTNDRILDRQIKDSVYTGSGTDPLIINEGEILILRNIGAQALDPDDVLNKVREIQRGWGFNDPFYSCVIEIQNPDGMEIDVGDQPITIDDVVFTNKVDSNILTGKTETTTGLHRIKVHKKNWKEFKPDIDTDPVSGPIAPVDQLDELIARDPLYPFNHKVIIEGFAYPSNYPETDEKVYQGADIFAELQMMLVSPFDIANNVAVDNFTVYALDRDAPISHTGGNSSTRVFVVKVDDSNPDFQNERFMIRFKEVNALRKYLRLRADLTTTNGKISPSLEGYKIKLR